MKARQKTNTWYAMLMKAIGAFMDRSILEGDPHNIIEGMIICAIPPEQNGICLCQQNIRWLWRDSARLYRMQGSRSAGTDILGSVSISIWKSGSGNCICLR